MTIPRCDIEGIPWWIVLSSMLGCGVIGFWISARLYDLADWWMR